MSRRARKTDDPDRTLRAVHEAYGAGYLAGVLGADRPWCPPGPMGGEYRLGVLDGTADRIEFGCEDRAGDADPV